MCVRCEERPQLGGLQPGLPVQHRGANLHRHQQPAAGRRPRVPTDRPHGRGCGGPGAPRPRPVPHRQPGPQPDLPGPIDPAPLSPGTLTPASPSRQTQTFQTRFTFL